jgi:hypothetical protein
MLPQKFGFHMPSAKDFRNYAQHWLCYADETENDEDREIFLEMATVWTQLELTSAAADIAKGKESQQTLVQQAHRHQGCLRKAMSPGGAPYGDR